MSMTEIGTRMNYDDSFFRAVSLGLVNQFHRKLKWTYTFDNNVTKEVTVPFYYSLTGSERYLLDTFVDDVPGSRLEGNVDPVPRGVTELNSYTILTNELTNPMSYHFIQQMGEDGISRKIYAPFRWVPYKLTYDMKVILRTELDVWRFNEALTKQIYFYKYFNVQHMGMNITCSLLLPDATNTTINREIGKDTDSRKIVNFSVDVRAKMPIAPIEAEIVTHNNTINSVEGRIHRLKHKPTEGRFFGQEMYKQNKDSKPFKN